MTRILEAEAVLARVANDLELYQELVTLFFDGYQEACDRMSRAVIDGDAGALSATAHSIKGALANLGAARAQEVARKLEMAGRLGSLENGESLVTEFNTEVDAFREELRHFLGH